MFSKAAVVERQGVTRGLRGAVERRGEGSKGLKEFTKRWQEVILSHVTHLHGK